MMSAISINLVALVAWVRSDQKVKECQMPDPSKIQRLKIWPHLRRVQSLLFDWRRLLFLDFLL